MAALRGFVSARRSSGLLVGVVPLEVVPPASNVCLSGRNDAFDEAALSLIRVDMSFSMGDSSILSEGELIEPWGASCCRILV